MTPPSKSYKQKVSAVDRFSDRYKIDAAIYVCMYHKHNKSRDRAAVAIWVSFDDNDGDVSAVVEESHEPACAALARDVLS